jgi:hypothetical protein
MTPTIHTNDKKNARKHRKMIRRRAIHPRSFKLKNTFAYRPTGKLTQVRDENDQLVWIDVLSRRPSLRLTDWYFVPPLGSGSAQ